MKSLKNLALGGVAAIALTGAVLSASAQVTVTVDPSASWIGYMNVFDLPADGGTYRWGSSWGTADLPATFSGTTLTFGPNLNCYNASDSYWANTDGSGAKNMDASMYVQSDALAGQTVTFDGTTVANTLTSPYTVVAFIKDFSSGYALVSSTTVALTSGADFSLNLATVAGDHIQYGFELIGPDANPATASALGNVQVTALVPEPSTFALLGLGLLGTLSLRRKS